MKSVTNALTNGRQALQIAAINDFLRKNFSFFFSLWNETATTIMRGNTKSLSAV